MADAGIKRPRDFLKWGLWAVLAALVALSAWIDDRFVVNAADPVWTKMANWRPLAPHALAGLVSLLIGPFQFSDRLRASRPTVHRWLGRLYIGAVLISAPLGGLIAWEHHTAALGAAQMTQAGGWFLVTAMALINALARNFHAHKLWMMRSYGFCMVFVVGRLPDLIPNFPWDEAPGITVSWAGVAAALVAPDLLLNARELLRRRR